MVDGASKENLVVEVTLVIEIWSVLSRVCRPDGLGVDRISTQHCRAGLSMFRASLWWLVSSCCACRGKRWGGATGSRTGNRRRRGRLNHGRRTHLRCLAGETPALLSRTLVG